MNPQPPMGCNVVVGPAQGVHLTPTPDSTDFDLDEDCTATTVSPTKVELACQTFEKVTIDITLNEPWTPNFEAGAVLHLSADAYSSDWPELDWRLDHADQTLALAGRHAFEPTWGFDDVGLGTIPVTLVTDACTPKCTDFGASLDAGLTFEFEGEEATLFAGGHATLAEHEVWVTKAVLFPCDKYGDEQNGDIRVFISGKPAG